jgi:hypothetical protein
MRLKTKTYIMAIMAFSLFSLALMPIAAAAGSITLTPTSQAQSSSVTVAGTAFGVTKAVGIGFGAEVAVTNEVISQTGSSFGPFIGMVAYRPVKPGTIKFTIDVMGGLLTYVITDNGNGTLASTNSYFANGTMNYVTGQYIRYSTEDAGSFPIVVTADYTRYQYNATPSATVNTTASGTFNVAITVPAVANGNYDVTAIDAQGNRAVATLAVSSAIPEVLPIGVIMLLSSFSVIAGSRYFRKRPRI